MRLLIAVIVTCLITGCDGGMPPAPVKVVDEQERQQKDDGGGMMEHMAGAAVAGAAAGTAGAVAHRATDHLINKHQERKARKQTRPRTYNHRRR